MATEVEATEALVSKGAAKPPAIKLPVMTLLVVVVLGVWFGIAGAGAALLFLVRSGRFAPLPLAGLGGSANSASSSSATRPVVLEPILVNLADEGGRAYLRLGLTLAVENAGENDAGAMGDRSGVKTAANPSGNPSEQESSVRDTILMVLGEQTSASLLGPDGKEHLKLELEDAIRRREPWLKLKDLYFTDFLVQI